MSRTLIKESAIYGLGSLLSRSLGLILIPLYTHYLTIAEYGTLALLNLTLVLTSFLTLMGISSGAMRFYYDKEADDEYRKKVYGNALIALIAFPPLALLVIGVVFKILFEHFTPSVPFFPLVAIILITGLFTPAIKLLVGLLRVQQRPGTFIIFNVGFFVFQACIIIFSLGVLKLGLQGQIVSQLIANALFWVVAVVILVRYSRPTFSYGMIKKLLAFGIPMIPFFIFMWINGASGRFILERYTSLEEVGIFSLAAQFSGMMLLIAVALDNAISPHFHRTGNTPGAQKSLGKLVTRYIALFGIVALGINVCAPPVILFIATPEYHDAIKYIGPLTLAYWIFICTYPITWSLTFSKRTGLLSTTRAISAVILVGLLISFTGYFGMGIHGIILSMIIVNLITIMVGYPVSQRQYKLSFQYRELSMVIVVLLTGGFVIESIPSVSLETAPILYRLIALILTAGITVKLLGLHGLIFMPRQNNE